MPGAALHRRQTEAAALLSEEDDDVDDDDVLDEESELEVDSDFVLSDVFVDPLAVVEGDFLSRLSVR
jgi:hypothetical protein